MVSSSCENYCISSKSSHNGWAHQPRMRFSLLKGGENAGFHIAHCSDRLVVPGKNEAVSKSRLDARNFLLCQIPSV